MHNWRLKKRYRRQVEADLKMVKMNILSINEEDVVLTNRNAVRFILRKDKTYKELYRFCRESSNKETWWHMRISTSCQKFKFTPNQFLSCSKPIWRDKNLTAFEKNTIYKLLFNCIRDKDVLWNKGLKAHPICYLCDVNFENLEHLLGGCTINQKYLQPCGIKSIEDVFQNPTTTTFKTVVTIVDGAWEDDAEKCLWKLETLLNMWFVIECSVPFINCMI